jgi:hypothetical protein
VDGLNSARLPTFKNVDMRFVKGFGLGRSQLNVYLDARNIFNFTNTLVQFVTTGDVVNEVDRDLNATRPNLDRFAQEGDANDALLDDGSLDLTFGDAQDRIQACGSWLDQGSNSAPLNCAYMVRDEERWGNGDGIFSVEEQTRVSDALYYANGRGENFFYGQGARFRLGVEFNF